MKFYIATRGNPAGIARMRALAKMLEAIGHENVHDWSRSIEHERMHGRRDVDLTFEEQRTYSNHAVEAMLDADVLIYLSPPEKAEGAAWEVGVAQGFIIVSKLVKATTPPISIVVVGKPLMMYASLAEHHVSEDVDVIDALKLVAQRSIVRQVKAIMDSGSGSVIE